MEFFPDDRAHEAEPGQPHGHRIGDSIDVCIRHPGELKGYRVMQDDDGGYAAIHVHEVPSSA